MPIDYDIDALLSDSDFLNAIRDRLPNPWEIEDAQLLPEERVLRGIAEFEGSSGNGIKDLVENENFDILYRAMAAARQIGDCLVATAMSEFSSLLSKFSFHEDPGECVEHYYGLSKDKKNEFESALDDLDRKFFFGDGTSSIWKHRDHVDRAKEYAREHLKSLRARKA